MSTLFALPDAPRLPRRSGDAPGAAAPRHRRDPDPARGPPGQLRPRLHRLTDLVAHYEHAGPLVPPDRLDPTALRREALRRLRGLPALLAQQPQHGQELGTEHGADY